MFQALIVIHVLIALSIIGLVLLQQGRGADAGAGFGGGASNTVFGSRGSASFLSRSTAVLAAAFFGSSLLLAYLGGKQDNKAQDIMEVPVTGQSQTDLPPVTQTASEPEKPSDLPEQVNTQEQHTDEGE